MKLMIFGATGGTGRQVVKQAVAAGHDVTVLARDPARVAAPDRVNVIGGDVLTISRADLAHYLITHVTDQASLHAVVEISG